MLLQENVALAPLTTIKVGGVARYFVEAKTLGEVQEAVSFGQLRNLPLFVLGGGSNVVVADAGWPGLMLKVAIPGIDQRSARSDDGKMLFDVGAGESWARFVWHAVMAQGGGVECLRGIPGSVGGTPVQNVGAYGQEVSETIASVLAYDLAEHRVRELTKSECAFGYRSSIFNSTQHGRYIVLRVTYELHLGVEPALRYADLQKHFAGSERKPTLAEVREAVLKIRAVKGMLLSPGDPDSRSAGSFFKNPVISSEEFDRLSRNPAERRLKVPTYPALSQKNKTSAAWLVENSGFHKGYAKGTVGISSKHALAIVNRGGATAADVIALRNEIQAGVERTWGVELESEPVFVGF